MDLQQDSPCGAFSRCFSRCCCCVTKPKAASALRSGSNQSGSKQKEDAAGQRRQKAEDKPSQDLLKTHQTAAAPEPSAELKRMREVFVESVSLVVIKPLLDRLASDGIFSGMEKEAILEENQTRADKAGCLIDSVMKKGEVACRRMIEHLLSKDPTLSAHLGLSMPPSAQDGQKSVYSSRTERKGSTAGRPGPQNGTGKVNEAFEKDPPEPAEILHSDGKKASSDLYRPTGTINNTVDLKGEAPPNACPSSQGSTDEGFQREFLEAHNAYRKDHRAPALVLSSELCSEAQRWAQHLLEINRLEPGCSHNGENTYCMHSSQTFKATGREAVDSWYSQVQHYDFSTPGFQQKAGSFTQVVWKGSKELGVGLASDGKRAFIAGHYRPAGNVNDEGYFEKNVHPKGPKISADEMFKKEFLDVHNTYRAMHGAPPLLLNAEMCAAAQTFADRLLQLNRLEKSGSEDGENTYYIFSSKFFEPAGGDAVENWYQTIKDYDFSRPGYQKTSGGFTQLVWKASKELGVGMSSSGTKAFVVGHYRPRGNINREEDFRKNVLPKGDYSQQPGLSLRD